MRGEICWIIVFMELEKVKAKLSAHFSELGLILALIGIFALVRFYYNYGGEQPLMIVWKGELSFKDTFVNLHDFVNQPRTELERDHKSVLWQLEDMGIMDPGDLPDPRKPKSKLREPIFKRQEAEDS